MLWNMAVKLPSTIKSLTYNKQKEWWEGVVKDTEIVLWTHLSEDKTRLICNCYTKEGDSLGKSISLLGILFYYGCAPIVSRRDNDGFSFTVGLELSNDVLENIFTYPILFWSVELPGEFWCIPDRRELWKNANDYLTEEQREKLEDFRVRKLEEQEQKKQEIQEQKEQTEQEWEEWEKRQEEDK